MSGSCRGSLPIRWQKRPARRRGRKAARGVCVLSHAEANSRDLRILHVLRKSQIATVGENLPVHSGAGSIRIDRTARGRDQPIVRKVQNEANGNRPQIPCPQETNVRWIRHSLCKTKPIPEEATRACRVSRLPRTWVAPSTLGRVRWRLTDADGR